MGLDSLVALKTLGHEELYKEIQLPKLDRAALNQIVITPLKIGQLNEIVGLLASDPNLAFQAWEREILESALKSPEAYPQLLLLGALAGPDARLVGVVLGSWGLRAHVSHLIVDSDYRGHNIGQDLLSAAENKFQAQGCLRVCLTLTEDNNRDDRALGFYKRQGYDSVAGEVTLEKDL